MLDRVPNDIKQALQAYVECARSAFGAELLACYVLGSIALGDFDPRTSDIDFLTVLRRRISRSDREKLGLLHKTLLCTVEGTDRMEGIYVAEMDLMHPDYFQKHPYVKLGRLQRHCHRVGPTTRRVLRDYGIVLMGASPGDFVPHVSSEALFTEMDFNLNNYWAPRARRPYLFLVNELVDFAVLTIFRFIHTLENKGTIISKRSAASHFGARFPEWGSLLNDVRSRFFPSYSSPPLLARFGRALETRRFIQAMIRYANRQHRLGFPP